MQKEIINIPGVSIKLIDIFKCDNPEIEKKREFQEAQQLNAIKMLYNSIYSSANAAAWREEKPNKDTKKGLVYILTRSIRKNVKIQLSVFLKDFKNGDYIALSHQDINNLDQLQRELNRSSGQQWKLEEY
jgi:hypothetical protein